MLFMMFCVLLLFIFNYLKFEHYILCVYAPCGLSIGVFHDCLLMFILPLLNYPPLGVVCWCSSIFLLGFVHYYLLTLLVITNCYCCQNFILSIYTTLVGVIVCHRLLVLLVLLSCKVFSLHSSQVQVMDIVFKLHKHGQQAR